MASAVKKVLSLFERRSAAPIRLQMAAMIDVVFLLLTFFLLAGHFQQPEHILPLTFSAGTPAPVATNVVTVTVQLKATAKGCRVQLDDSDVAEIEHAAPAEGLKALAQQLGGRMSASGKSETLAVRLICQPTVSWQLVSAVYDTLYGLGLSHITFVLEDSASESGDSLSD